jgi:hypothetical protein
VNVLGRCRDRMTTSVSSKGEKWNSGVNQTKKSCRQGLALVELHCCNRYWDVRCTATIGSQNGKGSLWL